MELDLRKLKVLAAVVELYTQTGEPVGSKAVCNLLDMDVSSATVRNDMAVLAEKGLIEQPHASAGRIPTHMGYRLYIDQMLQYKPLKKEERDEIDATFNVANPDPGRLFSDAADILSDQTGYTTILTTFTPKSARVKHIELIPADSRTLVVVVIATDGIIRSQVCHTEFLLTDKIVEFFTNFFNGHLVGMSLRDITARYVNSLSMSLGEYGDAFSQLLVAIYDLCRRATEGQYYTAGVSHLLRYYDYIQAAQDILQLLDSPEDVVRILDPSKRELAVSIGRENSTEELSNSALIVSKFTIGGRVTGALGLLGPVRMDYARLLPQVEYFTSRLSDLLTELFDTDEEERG